MQNPVQPPNAPVAGSAGPLGIDIGRLGAAAVVTLCRPRALNALNEAMRTALASALPAIARDPMVYCMVLRSDSAKAFCAGGDVRELVSWARTDPHRARRAFAEEYRLDWALECFSKPTIALIDGLLMGSGVGLTLYGTHRVAAAGYAFAMPETSIGLFPDVGVAHAFARMPDEVGMYLALSGRSIGRADALALGLVTHCIDAEHFPEILAALADAEPVDKLLDARHRDPGPGKLPPLKDTIRQCFSAQSVVEIVDRLDGVTGTEADWAGALRDELLTRSPTSLAITFRHVREAAHRSLSDVLEIDYRLACRCLEAGDFAEGVRAALIDKDGKPAWRPSSVEQVSEAAIASYFAPFPGGALDLATRSQMQGLV